MSSIFQEVIEYPTTGKEFIDITEKIREMVTASEIQTGVCSLFIQSAANSLVLCEDTNPNVRRDIEMFMERLVSRRTGTGETLGMREGDDAPSHFRALLSQNNVNVPIITGDLAMGQWEAIYLWEHRSTTTNRNVVVTILGDKS